MIRDTRAGRTRTDTVSSKCGPWLEPATESEPTGGHRHVNTFMTVDRYGSG